MENKAWRLIGLSALSLVVLMAAFVAIHWISESRLWSSEGAGWAQAIGSLAAIGGAVGIFRAEIRIRREDFKTSALLAAAKFALPTFSVSVEISSVVHDLNLSTVSDLPAHEFALIQTRLASLPDWPLEDIVALTPLPNKCALNFAFGLGRLNFAKAYLDITMISNRLDMDPAYRIERGRMLSDILNESWQFFDRAAMEMQLCTHRYTGTFHPPGVRNP